LEAEALRFSALRLLNVNLRVVAVIEDVKMRRRVVAMLRFRVLPVIAFNRAALASEISFMADAEQVQGLQP
jgi:hypothetical protein